MSNQAKAVQKVRPRPRTGSRHLRCSVALAACALAIAASDARASFLSGDALDAAANVLAWVVLVVVPIVGIAIFWMVHVLPEKIAHKRHHPQRQAIQTLCLLSLVFGGLLWPLAWLWAYTKPVGYKLAYGTDKHEDYFAEAQARLDDGTLTVDELHELRAELAKVQARGPLPPQLRALHEDVERRLTAPQAKVAVGSA
jgi:CBS domain containing-hemolysin-like protein